MLTDDIQVYLTISLHTYKSNAAENTFLYLANIPPIKYKWIIIPEILVGQRLIVVFKGTQHALYTLSYNNKPFQIAGTRDLLLDTKEYTDLTKDYINTLSSLHSILSQLFNLLTLEELNNNFQLYDFEWIIKEQAVAQKMNFNDIKCLCEKELSCISDTTIQNQLRNSLLAIKKTKNKLDLSIDWSDYSYEPNNEDCH